VFFWFVSASGVVLGLMGGFLGTAWLWAGLVIFAVIGLVMNVHGGRTIDRIADTRDHEMERLLAQFRPMILAVTGAGGLLLVLYLMLFKPTFG